MCCLCALFKSCIGPLNLPFRIKLKVKYNEMLIIALLRLTPGNAILNRARRLEKKFQSFVNNERIVWYGPFLEMKLLFINYQGYTHGLGLLSAFLRWEIYTSKWIISEKKKRRNNVYGLMDHWPPYTIYSIHNFLKKRLRERERRTTGFSNVQNAVFGRILQKWRNASSTRS